MSALLTAHDIGFSTPQGLPLLRDISLAVAAGELVGLIGPNGAGKSTLLKLMSGLVLPSRGEVRWQQQPLSSLSHAARARRIGYLEQRPHVHWPCSVRQVVLLARLPCGDTDQPSGHDAVTQALALTGTTTLAEQRFQTLSEGEKLQVHLARLLAGQPQAILADEPTAALDPARQLQVMQLLHAQSRRGLAVLAVLHDLTLAARYCDRLVLLHKGALVAEGSAAQVLTPERLASVYGVQGYFDAATQSVLYALPGER